DDRDLIRADCALWTNPPLFRITLFAGGESSQRNATLTSLQRQFYRGFRWAEIDAPPSEGEWFLWLQPGDQLAEHSLYWLAAEIVRHPATLMIYADDDEIDDKGRRCRPRFKPDWSALHLQATDYIGRACVVNGSVLPQLIAASGPVLAAANLWPLLSALGRQSADRIRHVPAVLLHRAAGVDPLPVVRRVPLRPPEPTPQVSIIIPTRNALHLLRACVESVLNKTTYSNFELLIVDNGSDEAECLAYLACIDADPRVRVLPYRAPFNYSAINNFAAAQATGEVLCLLNNDTEVIATDWLDEMVALLSLEGVGAVGGKLYYPDGRVQHAGDTVGPGGCANHLHQFLAPDDQGYCQRASVVQDLSAVTAACLVTWRDIFQRLGGLNERHLPVAFNDVDYCLRLRQTGYRVVWSPDAALYHHESVSRGKDTSWRRELRSWREVGYMRRTWRQTMRNDPFYNPNFSYFRADFVLGPAPNVKRPWVEGME
ncbi:MAG TPA: glycosyltransferase family 2 protein, partial [Accumulibacter sp.]|nr:glycosyltransferase family 2 protein [Accumulibacter sp.]